jgi:hypothetical protein
MISAGREFLQIAMHRKRGTGDTGENLHCKDVKRAMEVD